MNAAVRILLTHQQNVYRLHHVMMGPDAQSVLVTIVGNACVYNAGKTMRASLILLPARMAASIA